MMTTVSINKGKWKYQNIGNIFMYKMEAKAESTIIKTIKKTVRTVVSYPVTEIDKGNI